MFDIYLENFIENGQTVRGPRLVMSIPVQDPSEIWMVSPSYKAEIGKAESFDFSVNPGSPYYNAFVQFKTRVTIVYDGTVICYSRVMTINTSNMLQVRSIHTEGMYSVLKDAHLEGEEEDKQSKISPATRFTGIISEYNNWFNDEAWKKIDAGTISEGITSGAESKKLKNTSWTDALSALDSLVSNYGGYMRIRYSMNSNHEVSKYLDWAKDFYRDPSPRAHIKVSKNLIDFSTSSEISELFTRLIPIGQKSSTKSSKESKYIYLPGMCLKVVDMINIANADTVLNSGFHRYSDYANAEANYGVIYKTMSFQNANTVSKLRSYAEDWLKKNYYGALRTFTVKAIDMHMLGENDQKILVGDCVDFTYPEYDSEGHTVLITRKLVCKSATYNLFNPDQNTYTLGIPSDILDFEYGEKKKTKKASSTAAGAAAAVGGGSPTPPKEVTWRSILHYLSWFYYSHDWREDARDTPEFTAWFNEWKRTHNGQPPDASTQDKKALELAIPYARNEHAYSWDRRNGKIMDKKPYNTFNDFKEYKKVKEVVGENGDIATEYEYRYLLMGMSTQGSSEPTCRVMGHYIISPCDQYPNGYHYGVAWNEESGDPNDPDIFAFPWGLVNSDERVAPLFRFNDFWSRSSRGGSNVSGESSEETSANTTTSNETVDENTGASQWLDSEGNPSISLFPTLGSAGFGDAQSHWEDSEGNWVPEGTAGAVEKPTLDADGNPVWAITINSPIEIDDPDHPGQKIRIEGAVIANDLKLPTIPSFRTEVAAIHNAIIGRATIGELYANVAILGHAQPILDANGNITGVNGTQLEVNADNMIGAVGLFKKDQNGRIKYVDGKPCIDAGSAIVMTETEATFGIWHEGNLTGGMMVKKINNQTQTTIRGDKICLETNYDSEGNPSGSIMLSSIMTIRAAGGTTIKSDTYFDGDIYLSSGSSGNRSWTGSITTNNAVVNRKLIFSDPDIPDTINNAPSITLNKLQKTHVKVVSGDTPNTYNLMYLPAYLDPDTASESDWIDSGNFSRAASGGGSITPTWSGSNTPKNNLVLSTGSDEYVINFGNSNPISGKDIDTIIAVINKDDNGTEYPATISSGSIYSNGKYLDIPYRIARVYSGDGGDETYSTVYNGAITNVDASLVYNNGWNDASDFVALNAVASDGSSYSKDFQLVKPRKNGIGSSDVLGCYLAVDNNYVYAYKPGNNDDELIAKISNPAYQNGIIEGDKNRRSRIGNNVPNFHNVTDYEYNSADSAHKFVLPDYNTRYKVYTQYGLRDGISYADGDIYYFTTPADRFIDGQNDIINAGGAISQNGAVSGRSINQYVTTLTVTGAVAKEAITYETKNSPPNASDGVAALATQFSTSASNFTKLYDGATYGKLYGFKIACDSASNSPKYYYIETPAAGGSSITPTIVFTSNDITNDNTRFYNNIPITATSGSASITSYCSLGLGGFNSTSGVANPDRYCVNLYDGSSQSGVVRGRYNVTPTVDFVGTDTHASSRTLKLMVNGNDSISIRRYMKLDRSGDDVVFYFGQSANNMYEQMHFNAPAGGGGSSVNISISGESGPFSTTSNMIENMSWSNKTNSRIFNNYTLNTSNKGYYAFEVKNGSTVVGRFYFRIT